jgi:phage baseplate assembly protein gpV
MNFKFGVVSEAKPGFAKVYFMQDDMVTDWLPIVLPHTMLDKIGYVLNVNEHVACICDARCEEGVILGAIHSNPEPADDGATTDKFRQVYSDGGLFEYDKNLKQFQIQNNSTSIKDIFLDITDAIKPIMIIYGNNPDFGKLSDAVTKINQLFQ